ncbi:MAG: DNA polymerase III subunit epsilon [Halothiobacillus sp.]
MAERQIILDTETTGLPAIEGHRLVEIGAVELLDRRLTGQNYHVYLNPERQVDPEALAIHGLDDGFLAEQPKFAEIVTEFLAFIGGSELIIHNADFDVGFINNELDRLPRLGQLADYVMKVTDSLAMARQKYPGQRNSLDALCRRLNIDNSARILHGALLDSEILADVYLALTGGQKTLSFDAATQHGAEDGQHHTTESGIMRLPSDRPALIVIAPDREERTAHAAWLQKLGKEDVPQVWP